MAGGQMPLLLRLLLLAGFMILVKCQPAPEVTMLPKFTPIFSGDSIMLKCSNSAAGSPVTWHFNNAEVQGQNDQTWSIAVAAPSDSGSYHCESNGKKSGGLPILVLDYLPPASLSIYTGQPVMPRGDAFSLALQHEGGLAGWNCWFSVGGLVKRIVFTDDPPSNEDQIFQAPKLMDPEATYWCSDKTGQRRSSPVTIRTSEKQVLLEMAPVAVMAGDSVTLKCLVWGTSQIAHTIFYKDGKIIQEGNSDIYEIRSVKESDAGEYKCQARYTHKSTTRGPPRQETSDPQELFVRAPPRRAVLSAGSGMSCSCSDCGSNASYHWYLKENDQRWAFKGTGEHYKEPNLAGTYACRAVWTDRRTLLSNVHNSTAPGNNMVVYIIIILIIVGAALCMVVICLRCRMRRSQTEAIYQDVALKDVKSQDGADGGYEELQKKEREKEYDQLKSTPSSSEKKDGDYQALKKEEVKDVVYHTLGVVEETGAEGGYEALKKKEIEKEYETLGGATAAAETAS